jgi:hypothetical protein
MAFQPRASYEQENQNDDEPLFRLSENKETEEAFHRRA